MMDQTICNRCLDRPAMICSVCAKADGININDFDQLMKERKELCAERDGLINERDKLVKLIAKHVKHLYIANQRIEAWEVSYTELEAKCDTIAQQTWEKMQQAFSIYTISNDCAKCDMWHHLDGCTGTFPQCPAMGEQGKDE